MRRADTIVEELEEMILTGHFANGDRLDEITLAERFGVSRTPVREAFQKLGTAGLVEQIPRRGVFVRHPGPVELIEMFETMAELEAACGRLAAMRVTPTAIAEMKAANSACQIAVSAQDADRYYLENEHFHHLIYHASGNGFLAAEARKLHKRLKPFRRMQLHLRGRMGQSMTEHHDILAAIENGEPDLAAARLRDHVAVQGEKFRHLIASLKSKDGALAE